MKKAQGGINAAILVAIISALIIIYMMFLPSESTEDILEGDENGESDTPEEAVVLLKESVGRLTPGKSLSDITLPNVYLFEETNSKELTTINPIYVRNGWFDKKKKSAAFSLDDMQNTDNVLLSFSAPKRKGVLTIKLNNVIIYEYDLNKLNPDPIKIKKENLDTDNEIEFSVSGVGMAFWKTNEYSLENIKIIGDITDVSRQASRNTFSLTNAEYQNLDKAELRFIPYCSISREIGVLDITVNNRNIFSSMPICDDYYRPQVPVGLLNAGENKIIFKTTKGSYSIEQIKMLLTEKESVEAVYYFEINETLYDNIIDTGREVQLTLEFVDKEDRKRMDLSVNGHMTRVDQTRKEYTRIINNWIEEGNNFAKIMPKNIVDIVELRIEVEEE